MILVMLKSYLNLGPVAPRLFKLFTGIRLDAGPRCGLLR